MLRVTSKRLDITNRITFDSVRFLTRHNFQQTLGVFALDKTIPQQSKVSRRLQCDRLIVCSSNIMASEACVAQAQDVGDLHLLRRVTRVKPILHFSSSSESDDLDASADVDISIARIASPTNPSDKTLWKRTRFARKSRGAFPTSLATTRRSNDLSSTHIFEWNSIATPKVTFGNDDLSSESEGLTNDSDSKSLLQMFKHVCSEVLVTSTSPPSVDITPGLEDDLVRRMKRSLRIDSERSKKTRFVYRVKDIDTLRRSDPKSHPAKVLQGATHTCINCGNSFNLKKTLALHRKACEPNSQRSV